MIIPAAYESPLIVEPNFVQYRNRTLNAKSIVTIQVKGKKICINGYKQNQIEPTMCVHFATKEDAEAAHLLIQQTLWGPPAENALVQFAAKHDLALYSSGLFLFLLFLWNVFVLPLTRPVSSYHTYRLHFD